MDYINYLEEACGYNDTLSDVGSISISQSSNGKNKDPTDVKKTDPGYNKFYAHTKKIINGKTVKKQFQIKLYTTSLVPGSMIRSALGGGYNTNYRVGNKDEYLFYKVGLCTGECKSSNGSNTFFFDSPEQYEKTFNVSVPQNVKTDWYNRYNAEKKSRDELFLAEASKKMVLVR